jgi:hypothetical protein
VAPEDVEGLPTLPSAILCSHCYAAFPHFKVKKGDRDEEALRYAARLGSRRDLVEEFVACGVWPLAHGWVLGEIRPCRMPTLGDKMVRSLAFVVDLRGRDAIAFVREVESEAIKIVGNYVPKTEMIKSWDIRGSNVRLNRVFELNSLPYGPYPEGDSTDVGNDRGKQVKIRPAEGTSKGKTVVVATRKRKMDLQGTGDDEMGPRASGIFVELMGTCAGPGEVMSSPKLRETSSRMLKVTRGRWHRNDPIPRAAGDDYFTSCLARELRIFPYGRNIGAFVSAVMEKDRQDVQRKAPLRLVDPRRDAKVARPNVKGAAPSATMPPPAVPAAAARLPSPSRVTETAVLRTGGTS